jgi:hypothetical protein
VEVVGHQEHQVKMELSSEAVEVVAVVEQVVHLVPAELMESVLMVPAALRVKMELCLVQVEQVGLVARVEKAVHLAQVVLMELVQTEPAVVVVQVE